MSTVAQSVIELDEQGVAWISDTKIKVIEIVLDKLAHGSSPEEMHFQYPHLSFALIYAALAYYYEHQIELDSEIQRRWLAVNEAAALCLKRFSKGRLHWWPQATDTLLHPLEAQQLSVLLYNG